MFNKKKENNINPNEIHSEEQGSVHDQLLRTIKYTGQINNRLAALLESQTKQGKFKLIIWFLPVLFILFFYIKQHITKEDIYNTEKGYVAQVVLSGVIKIDSSTASADAIIPALRNAFADEKAKGVLLRISSPGGSPTQSILIHDELKKLQAKYQSKKLIVIGEEGLISGAYWVACAAENINVLPATMTGSIGVIMKSFDFSKLAARFDVKRLVIAAGSNKSRLDQFVEPKQEDIDKLLGISNQLHQQFISIVKESRGDRLNGQPSYLFSGDFWLGEEALELGLVDRITSTSSLLNEEFGTDVVKDYTRQPGFFDQIAAKNPLASAQISILDAFQMLTYMEYPTFE
jgi:protease-4